MTTFLFTWQLVFKMYPSSTCFNERLSKKKKECHKSTQLVEILFNQIELWWVQRHEEDHQILLLHQPQWEHTNLFLLFHFQHYKEKEEGSNILFFDFKNVRRRWVKQIIITAQFRRPWLKHYSNDGWQWVHYWMGKEIDLDMFDRPHWNRLQFAIHSNKLPEKKNQTITLLWCVCDVLFW